jgi:hypothetical protein
MWHQRDYFKNGVSNMQLQQVHAYCYGKHYVGDSQSGNIYEQSVAYLTDNGNNIRRVRRAPYIAKENEFVPHASLEVLCETGLQSALTGPSSTINSFFLQDSDGDFWKVTLNNSGIINDLEQVGGTPAVSNIVLSDQVTKQSFQIVATVNGTLDTVPVPFSTTTSLLPMATSGQALSSGIFVVNGVLATIPPLPAGQEPQLFLRWSDDGGHTWSNYHARGVGLVGNYRRRVIWRQLGTPRSRVYEVSMTDAYPLRIIDGYVNGDPGQRPVERLSDQLRKMA